MAYVLDEEEEELGTGPQASGQSSLIQGQSGTTGTGGPTSSVGQSATPFTSINRYIEANRPQTQKLAENVGGYVEGLGNTARKNIEDARMKTSGDISAGTVNYNQGLVNQAINTPEKLTSQQKTDYKKMRDASYGGPSSFEETQYYQPAQKSAAKAQEQSGLLKSAEGIGQVAIDQQKSLGRSRINQGAASLDSALLQSDPNANARLQQASKNTADIEGLWSGLTRGLNEMATGAKATTEGTKKKVQAEVTPQLLTNQNKLADEVRDRTDKAIKENREYQDALKNALSSSSSSVIRGDLLSDKNRSDLGITKDIYKQLEGWGNSLSDPLNRVVNELIIPKETGAYVNYIDPGTQINNQNIANQSDYAKYLALNDLIGAEGGFLSDPSLAGKANFDTVDLDWNKMKGEMGPKVKTHVTDAKGRDDIRNTFKTVGYNFDDSQIRNILKNDPLKRDIATYSKDLRDFIKWASVSDPRVNTPDRFKPFLTAPNTKK